MEITLNGEIISKNVFIKEDVKYYKNYTAGFSNNIKRKIVMYTNSLTKYNNILCLNNAYAIPLQLKALATFKLQANTRLKIALDVNGEITGTSKYVKDFINNKININNSIYYFVDVVKISCLKSFKLDREITLKFQLEPYAYYGNTVIENMNRVYYTYTLKIIDYKNIDLTKEQYAYFLIKEI